MKLLQNLEERLRTLILSRSSCCKIRFPVFTEFAAFRCIVLQDDPLSNLLKAMVVMFFNSYPTMKLLRQNSGL